MGGELQGPFDRGKGGPGGWVLLYEPELHLRADVLVADYAGWRRERMPRIPMEKAAFDLAPDWVCEVLSPRTAGRDRTQKLAIYARERVSYAWLIDPLARTLEVFRLDGALYVRLNALREDAVVRAEPLGSSARATHGRTRRARTTAVSRAALRRSVPTRPGPAPGKRMLASASHAPCRVAAHGPTRLPAEETSLKASQGRSDGLRGRSLAHPWVARLRTGCSLACGAASVATAPHVAQTAIRRPDPA